MIGLLKRYKEPSNRRQVHCPTSKIGRPRGRTAGAYFPEMACSDRNHHFSAMATICSYDLLGTSESRTPVIILRQTLETPEPLVFVGDLCGLRTYRI